MLLSHNCLSHIVSSILFYTESSQLLLCDLTLHFNYPVTTDDLKETEGNKPLFEEYKISDVFLASNTFSK